MLSKETIVGGGIVGAFQAYLAYKEAEAKGEKIRVTIYEKNPKGITTAIGIAPSLTPDECQSVIPPAQALMAALTKLFSEPGGIRVEDVPGVNRDVNPTADEFLTAVERYTARASVIDPEHGKTEIERRTKALFTLGTESMKMWKAFYDDADDELKRILEESNFNPCHEPEDPNTKALHKGYRIDLISGRENAYTVADSMAATYRDLGYGSSQTLSPDEVKAIDPSLSGFCDRNSELNAEGIRVWKNTAAGVWRPGGCIDMTTFLPKFYDYLTQKMGTYTAADGREKPCLHIKYERKVEGLIFDEDRPSHIAGIMFTGKIKRNDKYPVSRYALCTGEAVGTLRKFGLKEPAYTGFAGASLKLKIDIPAAQRERFAQLNHCMEVHREGVVLAWQARVIAEQVSMAVAGTKAFYADVPPHKDQDFARNRNLLQLNMINEVLPEVISLALNRDTTGQTLTEADLTDLEARGIAVRWVGTRAVAYDGFPDLGKVYKADGTVLDNAITAKALGSGGVSNAPVAAAFSRLAMPGEIVPDAKTEQILAFADTSRTP